MEGIILVISQLADFHVHPARRARWRDKPWHELARIRPDDIAPTRAILSEGVRVAVVGEISAEAAPIAIAPHVPGNYPITVRVGAISLHDDRRIVYGRNCIVERLDKLAYLPTQAYPHKTISVRDFNFFGSITDHAKQTRNLLSYRRPALLQ